MEVPNFMPKFFYSSEIFSLNMTICSIFWSNGRDKTCLSACCYVDYGRAIFAVEIDLVGEENVKLKDGQYYIRSKDDFGTCALLDEETSLCELGENRPFWCKQHNCQRDLKDYWGLHQEVRHYRKKRGLTLP